MILDTLKALGDITRLRLMAILDDGEYTVQELTAILKMGQSRVSRHLKILRDAGLLEVQHQGTWNYYRHIAHSGTAAELWTCLRAEMAAVPEITKDKSGILRIHELRRARSRSFFDRVAHSWDDVVERVLPTVDYRPDLLEKITPVDTLVEIGIGNGELLAQLRGFCVNLIGIDQSPAMLKTASERLQQEGLTDPDLRLGDMSHLPLPDGRADLLVLNMVLHHAPNPAAVLQEVARVLAPGGQLLLADFSSHGHDWVREELADQWLGFTTTDLETFIRDAGFRHLQKKEFPAVEQGAGVLLFSACKQVNQTEKKESST